MSAYNKAAEGIVAVGECSFTDTLLKCLIETLHLSVQSSGREAVAGSCCLAFRHNDVAQLSVVVGNGVMQSLPLVVECGARDS